MRIPELLAPVGSPDHLKIAINAGASAVYLSGKDYGARKYARNFTLEEIETAVNTAHLYNVRVYVTVNTLIRESEIGDAINYLSKLYSIGVDAVLVQDLGLIELICEYLPDLTVHASTQFTCENQEKLNYLESKGVKRVVLPREMRKDEIESLKTDLELEIFVHGALCYSYSGQCLMSSFKGGRSGNRGTCAQPCRQKYEIEGIDKKDCYLSPCDLNLYDKLNEIAQLNIRCIKIEGRMRSKEYLAIVVSSYRKALNRLKNAKKTESEELNLVFNRGFITGQFNSTSKRSLKAGHTGLKIGSVIRSEKNRLAIRLDDNIESIPEKGDGLLLIKDNNDYGFEISQNPIITTLNHFKKDKLKQVKDLSRKNKVMIVKKVWQNKKSDFNLTNSNVYLTKRNSLNKKVKEIENNGHSFIKHNVILVFSLKNKFPKLKAKLTLPNRKIIECEVISQTPFEKPLKKTVERAMIKKQLMKVDNYPYLISQININYDGTLFIPISKINKLRRDVFKKLSDEIVNSYKHEMRKIALNDENFNPQMNDVKLSFYTNNLKHLDKIDNVERVYLEIPSQNDDLNLKNEKYNLNYMITFLKTACDISQGKDYELVWKWPDICHDRLIKAFNKVNGILRKMNYNLPIMSNNFNSSYCSYSMNVFNSHSIESLKSYDIITLSPELSKEDYELLIKHCRHPEKVEVFIHGKVELMKSRYSILNSAEAKKNYKNYLIDTNSRYPLHKSVSNEEIVVFSDKDFSLISEVNYLKSLGFCNFSVDGRFRDDDYYKIIDLCKKALDDDFNQNELLKYCPEFSLFNYE